HARDRLADDRVAGGVLERRVLVELELEPPVAEEVGVSDALDRLLSDEDHAVPHVEPPGRDGQVRARELEEGAARGGRGLTDLDAAGLDREAGPGRTLVRGQRRVAL